MQSTIANETLDSLAAINRLDLDPIKLKLMDAEKGHGWSREYADHMELAYRRYLTLLVKYPDETIAPTKDIDKFWHGHILDTLKYADDCQEIFGKFLHHFPYYGMRGASDKKASEAAGNTMARLYQQAFGETLPRSAAWCIKADVAWCIKAEDKVADAAWCIKAEDKGTDTAWCIKAEDKTADAAWCIKAEEKATDTAWCIKADGLKRIAPDIVTRPRLAS